MKMANRFDEKYEIRMAQYEEIPEIMQFIDEYWKKGHILATNRAFFEYEMVVDGHVNFILAKTKETGKIEGVLGFLPCSKDERKLDIWGVIWKTIPGAMPMLGMEIKKRLVAITGARTDLGVGANPSTAVPLLSKICHFYTSKMKHYYRLSNLDNYNIAKVGRKHIADYDSCGHVVIKELLNVEQFEEFFDFATVQSAIPYKDSWYYKRRFFNHPIYKYNVWGIHDKMNKEKAIMVMRIQECNNSSVVRIVDYLGKQELFGKCGAFFDELLLENEYIDFYFDGFNEEYVKQAGMSSIDDSDNIIPDYFNPYEQINVDIYVNSSNNTDKCLFFKADGDQDRPN